MQINNKSTFKTIKQYLSSYRNIFYKRSFEIFVLIIISIITTQKMQSIKFIYEKFITKFWKKSLNSFYYFLKSEKHSLEKIMQTTAEIAISLIPEQYKQTSTIYLAIDDTLQPKFGEKFDNKYKLFDHAHRCGSCFVNAHQIVALTMSIPIYKNGEIKYITIPVGYKLFDKSVSKLELAKVLIHTIMPKLTGFQVIILCDTWYTNKNLLEIIDQYDNLNLIGAVRKNTVLYGKVPPKTGKRGRPKTKGEELDYKKFEFHQDKDFYVTTVKCKTNLYKNDVFITITVKDIENFSSVRMYLSTIDLEQIKSKDDKTTQKQKLNLYDIYKMRWNIEVIFYQQKTFWSFGNYMVRSKVGIEKYINLIGVAYSATILIPFISENFIDFQFCSPQEIKYAFGEGIKDDLFLCNLLKTKEIKENLSHLESLRQFEGIDKLAS